MRLRITVTYETSLYWDGEDLLDGCQTQGKNLLRILLEHYHARVVSFQALDQDRRLTCAVSAALKHLLDAVWPQVEPGAKRKVTNAAYTLPYDVAEEDALLCLKRLGKSELLLRVRRGHPDVWVDAWQRTRTDTLPSGTVTFLFTDIEGSTPLWDTSPETMRIALMRHDTLLRDAIESHNGVVFKTVGDAFCAAFASPHDAVTAALSGQLALHAESWPTPTPVRTRMALHMGVVEQRDNDYFGVPVNRVARLLSIGHGGQVLLSLPTRELVRDTLPAGASLEDKGPHRLKDLQRPEIVFQLLHPALPSEFPLLKSLDSPSHRNNLPLQLTSFIGREKEVAEIRSLAGKTRLLTLTGTGGCGKTRLALQVAADAIDESDEGVWFVELCSLSDGRLVPQAVATVLGVKEESGKPLTQTLVESLGGRSLLLLLDNCEHLLDPCARLAEALLSKCPRVRILASSRERLGVNGELIYPVPPLSLPAPADHADPQRLSTYESVRLFIERAMFQQPAFAVTAANAPALAQLCTRLDGNPYSIELAAALVRSLSVAEINTRLADRFRLLTHGARTAVPRQKSLRAMIDWSYELLNPAEGSLLRRLSVFAGGWTLEAAEAIGGDSDGAEPLDLVTSLTDKSLVLVELHGQQTRYRLLETTREYARDRLAETSEGDDARRRHEDFYLALAERAAQRLRGPEQAEWLRRLEQEHDNLRAALDREGGKAGFRIAAALWWFWFVRGHYSEGRAYLERLNAQADADPKLRADTLNAAGVLATAQGDYAAARRMHEQCLEVHQTLGNSLGVAHSISNLGSIRFDLEDYLGARELFEKALALYREVDYVEGVALTLNNLGAALLRTDELEKAALCFDESLVIHQLAGDAWKVTAAWFNMGNVAFKREEYGKAVALLKQCIVSWRDLSDDGSVSDCLFLLGQIALLKNDVERAATLLGASSGIREAAKVTLNAFDIATENRCRHKLTTRMGEEEFTRCWLLGRAMFLESAAAYAVEP